MKAYNALNDDRDIVTKKDLKDFEETDTDLWSVIDQLKQRISELEANQGQGGGGGTTTSPQVNDRYVRGIGSENDEGSGVEGFTGLVGMNGYEEARYLAIYIDPMGSDYWITITPHTKALLEWVEQQSGITK